MLSITTESGIGIINQCLVCSGLTSTRRQDDTDNEAIQCKRFGKDEDEDHAHEQFWLLSIRPGSREVDIRTTSR
jgi:hypothetical protein